MNVCIIRHAYFPDDARVKKEALALLQKGHSVDILCLRKNGQPFHEVLFRIRVYRVPLSRQRTGIVRYVFEYATSFIMMAVLCTMRHISRPYDRIQVNTMPDFLVFAAAVPKLFGVPVLLDLHEPTPELWTTKYGARHSLLRRVQTRIQMSAISYADACLTVTEALKTRLGERGADLNKITVVSNVCEEEFDQIAADAAAAEKGQPRTSLRLVTHGLIEERYGHDLIIRAIEVLTDRFPDIEYFIYGDGEYRSALTEMTQGLRCRQRIHFMGFVQFRELMEGILESDVGVIPMKRSPYSELIDTTKMYEYIALRKPVIASRLPPVEAYFDESSILFFAPDSVEDVANCLERIYHTRSVLKELAENAHRRYQALHWRIVKETYRSKVEQPH